MIAKVKKTGVAIVLAATLSSGVAVAVAGTNNAVGNQVEAGFRKDISELAKALNFVVQVSYLKQGTSGATAQTKWWPKRKYYGDTDFESEPAFSLNHQLSYGSSQPGDRLARIHTEFKIPTQTADDPLKGKPLLTIDSNIGWLGGQYHRLLGQKFDYKKSNRESISFAGIDGTLRTDRGLRHAKLKIAFSGLSVKADDVRFEVGPITVNSTTVLAGKHKYRTGYSETTLDNFSFHLENKYDPDKTIDARGEKIKLTNRVNDKNGAINQLLTFGADKIVVQENPVTNAKITFTLENLDADAYDYFNDLFENRVKYDEDTTNYDKDTLKKVLAAFAAKKPAVKIKDASARWNYGEGKLNFSLNYIGKGDPEERVKPTDFIGALNLSLPRQLFEQKPTAKQAKGSKPKLYKEITELSEGGFVSINDKDVTWIWELKNGILKSNGKKIAPNSFMQLLGFGEH